MKKIIYKLLGLKPQNIKEIDDRFGRLELSSCKCESKKK
jgi:hypothetical protein